MTHDSHSSPPSGPADPLPDHDSTPQSNPKPGDGLGDPITSPSLTDPTPPESVHRFITRLALAVTFAIGAAIGLIVGPLGFNDRLPEPLRSALLPYPADLAAQRAEQQANLDTQLANLRASHVSGVAFDELIAEYHARPDWQQLTDEIDATRTARTWRLLAAAAWCAAVLIACTIVIRRRRAAARPVDDAWHWARHTAALALGFCAAICATYPTVA